MAVLIEAKGSKRNGVAYFPFEQKRQIPVEVVDRQWRHRHWDEIKQLLSRAEHSRLASLVRLRGAIEGKSSNREAAAREVIYLSEPFQSLWAALRDAVAAGEFQPRTPGTIWKPPSPHPLEIASEFMFSLERKPHALLAAELTLGLSRLKPCMWVDEDKRLQFGLFCPDTLSAFYAVTILGFGIAACLRCGELFERDRADDQFCSERCQNTYLTAKRRLAAKAGKRKRQ